MNSSASHTDLYPGGFDSPTPQWDMPRETILEQRKRNVL